MSNPEVSYTMNETNTHSFFVCVVITVVVAILIIKIITRRTRNVHFEIENQNKGKAITDVPSNGEPLQIIRITHEVKDGKNIHGLELKIENLEKIMFHPDVKGNPVVIISIAGSFRKGKSFLLGFFLKCLETQSRDNWLSTDDIIKGFEWQGGTERVTSGIHIWSKPFICENQNKETVAVLLMDTQGVFDNDSSVKDCASIFALTNLISSVQIYNLMQQLQEDDLQHLEFFAAFGKLVVKESNETDINNAKFIYLIRDWASPYEYPYGKDGGNGYIKKQLEINSNQQEELQELRKKLGKYFPNIGGFLLPHPGKAVVTKKAYNGQVKDLDDDFVDNVKLFVNHILSKEMLIAKRIHDKAVTGEDIVKYIKAYVELLEKGEYPSPKTAFQATAEVGRGEAIKRAFKFYKDDMDMVCKLHSNAGKLLSMETFETYHKKSKVAARDNLRKTSKLLLLDHESECVQNLDILIKEEYTKLRQLLDEQIQKLTLAQEAKRAVEAEQNANTTLSKLKSVGTGIGVGIGTAAVFILNLQRYTHND